MPKAYPPELAQFVQQELQSGAFHTEDELVAAALMAYRELKQRHGQLRRDARNAIAEADRGEAKELDIEEIIARGTKRLADQGIAD